MRTPLPCCNVPGDPVVAMTREGLVTETGKITKMFARRGSTAIPMDRAVAGDIIQIAGLQVSISLLSCALCVQGPFLHGHYGLHNRIPFHSWMCVV